MQILKVICFSFVCSRLLPEEQKMCHRETRGTGNLLYIDQHILKESKERRENVAMAWVDFKKTYNTVLQSRIIDCLKMYKISDKGIKFIPESLKNRKVELRKKNL